jgi:hypothetical protein
VNVARSACKNFIRILEFVAKYNLRKDREFKESKGRSRVEVVSLKLSSEGRDVELFGRKPFKV